MGGRLLLTATLAALVVSCNDNVGGPQAADCADSCIPAFPVIPHHYLLTVGDTARFVAHPVTVTGAAVPVTWVARAGSTGDAPITVDASGLARAVTPGRGYIDAHTANDASTSGGGRAEVWVVSPDTSAQPFIALYRDARTGDTLRYGPILIGRDSIDIVISYVIGNNTNTLGTPPTLRFLVRPPNSRTEVYSATVPATVRGRSATATVRLNLRLLNAFGAPVFSAREYEFFALLPLADGRVLGDQTPYPVVY